MTNKRGTSIFARFVSDRPILHFGPDEMPDRAVPEIGQALGHRPAVAVEIAGAASVADEEMLIEPGPVAGLIALRHMHAQGPALMLKQDIEYLRRTLVQQAWIGADHIGWLGKGIAADGDVQFFSLTAGRPDDPEVPGAATNRPPLQQLPDGVPRRRDPRRRAPLLRRHFRPHRRGPGFVASRRVLVDHDFGGFLELLLPSNGRHRLLQ